MSKLPIGWEKTCLKEICSVIRGITFPASAKEAQLLDSNVCCLRTTNIQREIGWSNTYFISRKYVKRQEQFVQIGDILMSMANSYELVGKVAIAREVPFPTAFGAFLAAIRPTPPIHGKFLFHLLRTNRVQELLRVGSSQTVNIANISAKALSEITIQLPPLNEQKRIADKLDSLLAAVDSCGARLDKVPALIKRFRQSVLAAATSGTLTEDWRQAQNLDNILVNEQIINVNERYQHPASWTQTSLGQLATLVTSGSRGWADFYSKSGATFIRAQNIKKDELDLSAVAFVTLPSKAEGKRSLVNLDDLLITITGANVGKSARVHLQITEAYVSQHVALVKLKDRRNAKFLEIFCWAENAGRGQLNEFAYGGGKPGLNLRNIKDLVLGLPDPLEQTEIVRRVENLFAIADKLEANLTSTRKRVEQLTPVILAQAFRGELVAQDPNDEPASTLLARISDSTLNRRKAQKAA